MIAKERHPEDHHDIDRCARAGAKAEERMAFYLRRAFGDIPNVLVLHDLRLPNVDGTDAAQIDHLVIHSGGMVIIESKSVTSTITINEQREFIRWWGGEWKGMDSPIQQSKRQAEFLQQTLRAKGPDLLDRALFGLVQKNFGMVPFDILVAISDTGVITRKADVPEVLKADQVVDKIRELMANRCVSFASFALRNQNDDRWISLSASEMQRIADFLIASHRPPSRHLNATVQQTAVAPADAIPIAPQIGPTSVASKPICKHCASPQIHVTYGRNYYLKCSTCGRNTPIDYTCPKCGMDARIRQDKKVAFYRECSRCGHSEVFWVNG